MLRGRRDHSEAGEENVYEGDLGSAVVGTASIVGIHCEL